MLLLINVDFVGNGWRTLPGGSDADSRKFRKLCPGPAPVGPCGRRGVLDGVGRRLNACATLWCGYDKETAANKLCILSEGGMLWPRCQVSRYLCQCGTWVLTPEHWLRCSAGILRCRSFIAPEICISDCPWSYRLFETTDFNSTQ